MKVLIVDDEAACRDSTRMLLSLEGFDVATAASGQEALEVAREFLPDVALIDWMLQDRMDGLQVAQFLREARPEVGIVMITGHLSSELEARINSFPAAEYLTKPTRSDDLTAAIRKTGYAADGSSS